MLKLPIVLVLSVRTGTAQLRDLPPSLIFPRT
jgi:hypothetical protein